MSARRGRGGLRRRIVWSTAVISALAMSAIIATVLVAMAAITRSSVRTTLDDRFDVLSAAVSTSSGGAGALETPDDTVDDTSWLFDADGREVDGPQASRRAQAVADSLATVGSRTRTTRHERVYLAGPVRLGQRSERTGVLVVSASLEPYESTRTELVVGLVLVGLLVTAGTTGIAAWTARRTLTPVGSMAALAEDWSAQQLDARFDDRADAGDDEIAHLGRTLNVLLDRVAGALRGEQRLTSELAHELRTPLTAIRGECELALLGAPDAAGRERLERVVDLVDRMSSTITTLLDIARGAASAGGTTTLSAVLEQAVAARPPGRVPLVPELAPAYASVRVAAGTEVVARVLAPLLDNADAYAASRVVVSCTVEDRRVVLSVSDDGPGLPDGADDLFEAGARGRDDTDGAGLGLALSRRAARSLGGEVVVASSGSPTTFAVTLPRS